MKTANYIVKEFIRQKDLKQGGVGEKINLTASGFSRLLNSNDMTVTQLFSLSIALEHNFFADMAKQLPKEIRGQAIEDLTVADLIKKEVERQMGK